MPERLGGEILQKERYRNTITPTPLLETNRTILAECLLNTRTAADAVALIRRVMKQNC